MGVKGREGARHGYMSRASRVPTYTTACNSNNKHGTESVTVEYRQYDDIRLI